MYNISTEDIVKSLFAMGFEKVDTVLFGLVLATTKFEENGFKFSDLPFTQIFLRYMDYDGFIFTFKEGVTLDTEMPISKNYSWTLRRLFNHNRLINYLSTLDFKDIVLRKIKYLGEERLEEFDYLFSEKEKLLAPEYFHDIKNTRKPQ